MTRLGIDFGTAHTVAVLHRPGREPRLLLFDGSPLLPSAVCAEPDGRLLVGRDALHAGLASPGSFEPNPKRCVDDRTVLLGEVEVTVTDLIGAVIDRVRSEAAQYEPTEVVLTYPAAWGPTRQATLRAAAGADVRLMPEPVAAAHHFTTVADDLAVGEAALVYDFGAGTFDASVVRRTSSGFAVVATEGLPDCGGLDVDAAIVAYLGSVVGGADWARLTSPESTSDQRSRRQLWENVRTAKEMLSRSTRTLVHLPVLDREEVLGREQLSALAAPLIERTMTACRAALRSADCEPAAIYLTGGSSRIPAVATALHQRFGVVPTVIDQPELAVAEGSVEAPATEAAPAGSPDVPDAPERSRWWTSGRKRVAVGVSVVVAALLATAGIVLASSGGDEPVAAKSPTPSVVAAAVRPSPKPTYAPGVDPCVVGDWRLVGYSKIIKIDGQPESFSSNGGQRIVYRADGTMTIIFSDPPLHATVRGVRWYSYTRGTVTGRYRSNGRSMIYTSTKADGEWFYLRGGARNTSGRLALSPTPEDYVCAGDKLNVGGPDYSQEFNRAKP